ncbi:MAG: hypothetical protein M1130_13390 [Actinobacteria bacterium]|nr:hypothetical protein [Actinomycetota bacterium]
MHREAELFVFFKNKASHRNSDGFMARYASLLSRNYSTFREWTAVVVGPQPGRTLAELLIGNFATMRDWGALTSPRVRRED